MLYFPFLKYVGVGRTGAAAEQLCCGSTWAMALAPASELDMFVAPAVNTGADTTELKCFVTTPYLFHTLCNSPTHEM